MAKNTKIEWTNHTINLWWGCSKKHTGCKNCYAEHLSDNRYKNNLWGESTNRKRIKSAFPSLARFQKEADLGNRIDSVFVGSMMDIFENPKPILNPSGPENQNTAILRDSFFQRVCRGEYSNLRFLFLTKRPDNISRMAGPVLSLDEDLNVWFGTSISNEQTLSWYRVLQKQNVSNRFLSVEPQVGPINEIDLSGIGWVIQGGESGTKKRPFDIMWAYRMRDICKEQGVPYFFKQIDKQQPIPDDLMIRQTPWDE